MSCAAPFLSNSHMCSQTPGSSEDAGPRSQAPTVHLYWMGQVGDVTSGNGYVQEDVLCASGALVLAVGKSFQEARAGLLPSLLRNRANATLRAVPPRRFLFFSSLLLLFCFPWPCSELEAEGTCASSLVPLASALFIHLLSAQFSVIPGCGSFVTLLGVQKPHSFSP